MLDLVPFARPRRKMTDRNWQAGVIREFLQLDFPEAQAPAIAPSGVRGNQNGGGVRVQPLPF